MVRIRSPLTDSSRLRQGIPHISETMSVESGVVSRKRLQASYRKSMNWVSDNDQFKRWSRSHRNAVLHIYGPLGAATTILSSHIISLLERRAAEEDAMLATFSTLTTSSAPGKHFGNYRDAC
jgi:hypothetical protein